MNAKHQGSHVVFETDHFSLYVIVDVSKKENVPEDNPVVPDKPEVHTCKDGNADGICDGCGYDFTRDCSCRCHSGSFIVKFIWKFTNFFNKILRRNPVCSCGKVHY